MTASDAPAPATPAPTEPSAENDARRYRMDEAVLIPGTPVFGCPICLDPWESEPSCAHYLAEGDVVGCCGACNGYGGGIYGLCWDCRGTGCAHPDPLCVTPPTKDQR